MDWNWVMNQIPNYASWTLMDFVYHAGWGSMGGILRAIHGNQALKMPERLDNGSIQLNAVGTLITAAIVGMLFDTNPLLAVIAGASSPLITEFLMSGGSLKEVLRRWIKDV